MVASQVSINPLRVYASRGCFFILGLKIVIHKTDSNSVRLSTYVDIVSIIRYSYANNEAWCLVVKAFCFKTISEDNSHGTAVFP